MAVQQEFQEQKLTTKRSPATNIAFGYTAADE